MSAGHREWQHRKVLEMELGSTVPLGEAVAIALICAVIFATVACLLMRYYLLMGFRMERIRNAVDYLHGLFARQELEALRRDRETKKLLARTGNEFFEITPAPHDRLSPEALGQYSQEELAEALEKLRRDKRYEEIDWHEDDEHRFRELRLRPEFLHRGEEEKTRPN